MSDLSKVWFTLTKPHFGNGRLRCTSSSSPSTPQNTHGACRRTPPFGYVLTFSRKPGGSGNGVYLPPLQDSDVARGAARHTVGKGRVGCRSLRNACLAVCHRLTTVPWSAGLSLVQVPSPAGTPLVCPNAAPPCTLSTLNRRSTPTAASSTGWASPPRRSAWPPVPASLCTSRPVSCFKAAAAAATTTAVAVAAEQQQKQQSSTEAAEQQQNGSSSTQRQQRQQWQGQQHLACSPALCLGPCGSSASFVNQRSGAARHVAHAFACDR